MDGGRNARVACLRMGFEWRMDRVVSRLMSCVYLKTERNEARLKTRAMLNLEMVKVLFIVMRFDVVAIGRFEGKKGLLG